MAKVQEKWDGLILGQRGNCTQIGGSGFPGVHTDSACAIEGVVVEIGEILHNGIREPVSDGDHVVGAGTHRDDAITIGGITPFHA